MKEAGTVSWTTNPNTIGNNNSGFAALPGGFRGSDGFFNNLGDYGLFWSATTDANILAAKCSFLFYFGINLARGNTSKVNGGSVRCIRD